MLWVKIHRFYIEKKIVKKEKISLGIVKYLERMCMKWNKLKLKNKTKTKESMVYTTFSISTKCQHLNVQVNFIDFERVISLYENHTAVWSNHIWRSYFPLWKSSYFTRGITRYKISFSKVEKCGKGWGKGNYICVKYQLQLYNFMFVYPLLLVIYIYINISISCKIISRSFYIILTKSPNSMCMEELLSKKHALAIYVLFLNSCSIS